MFKAVRTVILLFILASVALVAWLAQSRPVEWKHMLPVNIYLINGDGSTIAEEINWI